MASLPFVDSVTPASGPPTGGTAVTISGHDFTGTTAVTFDGTPAASFAVVDDNTITAVTPAGTGAAVVEITNAVGSSEDPIPPVMFDSSGSGNDALYDPDSIGNVVVDMPGLVVGNAAARIDGGATNALGGNAPIAPGFGTGDVFMCGWMQSDTVPVDGDVPVIAQLGTSTGGGFGFAIYILVGPSPDALIVVHRGVDDPGFPGIDDGSSGVFVAGVTLDTDPHFYAVTYEAATDTYTAYVDGVSVGTVSGTHPGIPGLESERVDYIGHGSTTQLTFDEVAWGPTLLSPTDVADLYAAAGDFATYDALMLSFGPTGYYHLDETRGGSGLFNYATARGWYVGQIGMGTT